MKNINSWQKVKFICFSNIKKVLSFIVREIHMRATWKFDFDVGNSQRSQCSMVHKYMQVLTLGENVLQHSEERFVNISPNYS